MKKDKNTHPLLSRLIQEVKQEAQSKIGGSYNRTHNRHNRGQ